MSAPIPQSSTTQPPQVRIQDATTTALSSVYPNTNDGQGPGNPVLGVLGEMAAYNGGAWDRLRTAQALDAGAAVGTLATHVARLFDSNFGGLSSVQDKGVAAVRSVSPVNTATLNVLDLRNLNQIIVINMAASAGTATLLIEGSADGVNWLTIDTFAAAAATSKQYLQSTVGATTPLSPLGFRYMRVTVGAAGVGNTTTLSVGVK